MGASYIPTKEALLDDWLLNFKTLIAASPTSYSLSTSDATAITAAFTSWHAAYLAATNPTTRNKTTVVDKNVQKANVLAVVRSYAALIRPNHAVSDALKTGLGLHIADTSPTPVPPPSSYPVLTINSAGNGVQQLHAADQFTPTKRARPVGTTGLLLFRAVDTTPAGGPSDAPFLSLVTRAAYQSTFDSADNGKIATYFARWTNSKGEVGPWSPGVSMTIAA